MCNKKNCCDFFGACLRISVIVVVDSQFFESLPKCYFRRCYFWTPQKHRSTKFLSSNQLVTNNTGLRGTVWPSHALTHCGNLLQISPKIYFSNFSCMFLNPNKFFPIWILIVLIYWVWETSQGQVKKTFCYQELFWPFTVRTNCSSDLKKMQILGLQPRISKVFLDH